MDGIAPAPTEAATCARCNARLAERPIDMAFRRDGAFLVIRGIPALVCEGCGEEYVSDPTALALDRMRGEALAPEQAAEVLRVPVFDFRAIRRLEGG